MSRLTILLADDHTLIVEGFRKILEPEFTVVGSASDGRSLLELALQLKPDVILLDMSMPGLHGLAAGAELKRLLPRTKLVVVTVSEDAELARESLKSWASGYLLKKSAGSELIAAIRSVSKGNSYVSTAVARRLEDAFVRDPLSDHSRHLTTRQREVLRLLAEGKTMKEAAETLHVTPRTIAFHKYRIMEDFDIKTNSDLFKLALREKIIPTP